MIATMEIMRPMQEGGVGMWVLLGLMLATSVLVAVGFVVLLLVRARPFWRMVAAGIFAAVGVAVVGIGVGFHALAIRNVHRAVMSADLDMDSRARIEAQGRYEASWLYLFAPIAAAPSLIGGALVVATAGLRREPADGAEVAG